MTYVFCLTVDGEHDSKNFEISPVYYYNVDGVEVVVNFSIWYISPNNRVIGISPMVSLKNNNSTVNGRIALNDGTNNNKRPKRVGCRGYLDRT